MKAYDRSLIFSIKDKWLLLKNAKGCMIGRRGLKTTDALSLGAKISFPNHVIRIGLPLLPQVQSAIVQDNHSEVVPPIIEARVNHIVADDSSKVDNISLKKESVTFAEFVHAALFRGLSFSHGMNFAKDVKSKFNSDVHPSPHTGHFFNGSGFW
jgi:hypothetical protein